MKKLFLSTAIVFAAAGAGFAQPSGDLPTVDQILKKYVAACGGKAALEKHTSRVMKGTIEVVTYGVSGSIEMFAKAPNKQLSRSEFDGYGQVLQGFDGKTAWSSMPDSGLRELSGQALERAKASADFSAALHLKDRYTKAAVTGKGKAGERAAYIVEAESAAGPEKLYFDSESGLLVRSEVRTEQGPAAASFEDYKEVDGVRLPHTIKQESEQMSIVIKFAKMQHDVAVEDTVFAKPAK